MTTRVFVAEDLRVGQLLSLPDSVVQHLLHVLRFKRGDRLVVFNSKVAGEFDATIHEVRRGGLVVLIGDYVAKSVESPLKIDLWQGISRGEKMDFTLQKAVELGVQRIFPLFTRYCNVKLTADRLHNRLSHWQRIAVSAAEQSGRCLVPSVAPAQELAEALAGVNKEAIKLILSPSATNSARTQLDSLDKPDQLIILVGPEGGFSADEVSLAEQAGFIPMALGPRILRTETAALAAISVLQAKFGDF